MIYFTSDTHYGHENICRGTSKWEARSEEDFQQNTRDFKTLDEMNDAIVDGSNSVVGEDDVLYHLGDWSFGGIKNIWEFRKRIKCKNIHLILGNHDAHIEDGRALKNCFISDKTGELISAENSRSEFDEYASAKDLFTSINHVKTVKFGKNRFFLSHFSHRVWNRSHHGVIHLYGHCVDTETEILTSSGWKNVDTISLSDRVYSYNNGSIIENNIVDIFKYENITDPINVYDTQQMSLGVTDNHKILTDKGYANANKVLKTSRVKIPISGEFNSIGVPLTDNLLKLYIYLAADGSVNLITSLGRLRVLKLRKVNAIRELLNDLQIEFSENIQKDGSICFNFKIPSEILEYNIKGLDWKLLQCNKKQVEVIELAYSETDGYVNKNCTVIFTSKETEKDILHALFALHNYKSTVYSRTDHGFSKKISHQITVTKNKEFLTIQPNKFAIKQPAKDGRTWCIQTEIGNFMCRRNGKIHFTGNSHNSIDNNWGKSMDVGIDAVFALKGKYRPLSVTEIIEIMDKRDILVLDHHNKYTN